MTWAELLRSMGHGKLMWIRIQWKEWTLHYNEWHSCNIYVINLVKLTLGDTLCWEGLRFCVSPMLNRKNYSNSCILIYIRMYTYMHGINLRFVITKFRVTVATNYKALTCLMRVSYVVDHERARGLLFQCILCILQVLVIFWCMYVKCSTARKGNGLHWFFVVVIRGRWRYASAPTHHSIT
jgi:hypothetical protein